MSARRISSEISITGPVVLSPRFTGLETNPDRNPLSFTKHAVERGKSRRLPSYVSWLCCPTSNLNLRYVKGLHISNSFRRTFEPPHGVSTLPVFLRRFRIACALLTRLAIGHPPSVMTSDQVRDYLEKQLFIENTVVR